MKIDLLRNQLESLLIRFSFESHAVQRLTSKKHYYGPLFCIHQIVIIFRWVLKIIFFFFFLSVGYFRVSLVYLINNFNFYKNKVGVLFDTYDMVWILYHIVYLCITGLYIIGNNTPTPPRWWSFSYFYRKKDIKYTYLHNLCKYIKCTEVVLFNIK